MAKADLKEKINFICTAEQKQIMLKQVQDQHYKSLTEFIISKCTGLSDQAEHTSDIDSRLLQLEVKHLEDKLARSEQDLLELKAKYNVTFNAMLYHSLPFWRKWGKRLLELPNTTPKD